MSSPVAATAAVKRELLVRHVEAWASAALHRSRRATYVHGYAEADGGEVAEAALRALAEMSGLLPGRSLAMLAVGTDTATVADRLRAVQTELGTPAELAVHTVDGGTEDRLSIALRAAGAQGAPLLTYLDASATAPPAPHVLAATTTGRPAELLLVVAGTARPAGSAGELAAGYRAGLREAGFGLLSTVEMVADDTEELLVFATSSGRSLESFKEALWAVDEYAGVRYRDPADPERHLLDISLSPHPGPLRRELLARVAAVGEATVTELRTFALTDTVYRAADASRVLSALVASRALTRRPEHGRLGGDVVIGLGAAGSPAASGGAG